MRLPLRFRLAAAYCSAFLLLLGALELGAYFSVRTAVYSIVDRELKTRLAGLDDHLTRHIGLYTWHALADSLRVHPAFDPEGLRIQKTGGDVLLEGRSFEGVRLPAFGVKPNLVTLEGPGHVLRVLTIRRVIRGESYDLELGTDLLVPSAILERLWLLMLLSLPAVLLLASSAGYWIAGRALAPVSAITAAARSIDSTRLNQRIPVPQTRDEIQQLAETVNRMLARIQDGVEQNRKFTANASHELRTPLATIRASAEIALLRSSGNERSYREALHRILRQAERNSALLEGLLQLARYDAGSDQAGQEPLDLNGSLAQACAEIAPLAQSKDVRVSLTLPSQVHGIKADEAQLRRLWLILLDNAVKYTPSGGSVAIRVGETNGFSFCEVTDSGIGIPAEHLSRIFDRFYRVDKARSRSEGGAGLGLAIALEIAKLHDARIEVRSEPGVGSAFRVVFRQKSTQAGARRAAVAQS